MKSLVYSGVSEIELRPDRFLLVMRDVASGRRLEVGDEMA